MPILETRELETGYDHTLIGPVDLSIPDGTFLLIEGPNGIGKSTLLKTLVDLHPPIGGEYEWSVDEAAIRYVPQVQGLDPILPATVEDVLATGSQRGSSLGSMAASMEGDQITEALEKVGMADQGRQLFRDLSEGQKQLVLLARAIAGPARALVLDEPTASMDPERERRSIELLHREFERRNLTILIVSHGNRHARDASNAVLEIDPDRNVELNTDA